MSNKEAKVFKTIVEGFNGERIKEVSADKKGYATVLMKLNKEFHLNLVITPREKKRDKDLDWAK